MCFKKKSKVMEAVDKVNESIKAEEVKNTETKPEKPVEEWIWVTGYKGTDKDMKCRDYQYALGELHNMPNEADIVECESGFHMCKNLNDVFKYYHIGNDNRFFKVRALVRKSDYEQYGDYPKEYYEEMKCESVSNYIRKYVHSCYRPIDKLVAKSIIFDREMTTDEILENCIDIHDTKWTDKYKKLALNIGIENACVVMQKDDLVNIGYSIPFAQYIIDSDKYRTAMQVGALTELSMDMKCWLIFK